MIRQDLQDAAARRAMSFSERIAACEAAIHHEHPGVARLRLQQMGRDLRYDGAVDTLGGSAVVVGSHCRIKATGARLW